MVPRLAPPPKNEQDREHGRGKNNSERTEQHSADQHRKEHGYRGHSQPASENFRRQVEALKRLRCDVRAEGAEPAVLVTPGKVRCGDRNQHRDRPSDHRNELQRSPEQRHERPPRHAGESKPDRVDAGQNGADLGLSGKPGNQCAANFGGQ
jgi:hypothetical protein